ncbi:MAG: DNA polymerase I [Planctomycetota bacterium]|nr:MAG: DNA polymerase I [Planctomycetota bacterium]
MPKSCYLIDGHYQIYRSFYAPFRNLTSPSGEPTRATYVFFQMLFNILRERQPDYLAMVMDVSDERTFRREIDPEYKAHRPPPPEDLVLQQDRIVSLVEAAKIPILSLEGFEADDLMASIAHRLRDEDVELYLVSRDKDLEQLLSDRVKLYDAASQEVIDAETLRRKKGYDPREALEIQTLTGDSTDNVPGVPGVGLKTALKLIREYGSAENVVRHADELSPKLAERLRAFTDRLPVTRKLVTLRTDVPLSFDLRDCAVDRIDLSALRQPFRELSFRRLAEQLDAMLPDDDKPEPSASPRKSETKYELIDTPQRFAEFAERLSRQTVFAFDTETTGLNPVAADIVGLSFCWKEGEACYLPLRAMLGKALSPGEVFARLGPLFEDPKVRKVGQNIKYDLVVLLQQGVRTRGVSFDTRLASFLLDPDARSHSIETLARRWFDHDMIPITDLIGKGKNQITLDQVDTRRVCEYAAEDADYTWRLYRVLTAQMEGSFAAPLFHETEVPLIEVLAEMEHTGIALDTAHLERIGKRIRKRMDELTERVHKLAGRPFNLDSPKQLAEVLFDEQGLHVVRKTKTGRSTDQDTLATLTAATDHPIPPLVLEYRELAKLKSTYIDTLPKMVCPRTGRIHASFDQTGTVTGRLSSRDPNLQNIPVRTEMGRQIRRAFVAGDDDHVLLSADYSQIELRLLAHFSEDEGLCRAFEEGRDIHRMVAAEIHGIPLDDVTAEQRSRAKAVNFGIIYGQTAYGLARALGIPVGEAQDFIDAYFERFPGIRTFIDRCVEKAKESGYAETILGRRRPIRELRSRNHQQVSLGKRLAVNTVVQGSAADLIKRAMLAIHAAGNRNRFTARMTVQVHDELLFEIRRDRVEKEAPRIRRLMETAMSLRVPLVADIAWGPNWAETKP